MHQFFWIINLTKIYCVKWLLWRKIFDNFEELFWIILDYFGLFVGLIKKIMIMNVIICIYDIF